MAQPPMPSTAAIAEAALGLTSGDISSAHSLLDHAARVIPPTIELHRGRGPLRLPTPAETVAAATLAAPQTRGVHCQRENAEPPARPPMPPDTQRSSFPFAGWPPHGPADFEASPSAACVCGGPLCP